MASTFYDVNNSFPRTINLGAKDNSKGELVYEKAPLTWHIPLIYIFSDKGKSSKVMGTSAAIESVFGKNFCDPKSAYFQHPANLYNLLQDTSKKGGGGATCMIKRLIPNDAVVKSNMRLYLDVIKAKVPNYKRNSDGSYNTKTGDKVLDDTTPWIDGYWTRWTYGYDADANKSSLSVRRELEGSIALWKMEEGANIKHLTKDETTVDDTDSGHQAEANNTIYVYESKEDMYMPAWGETKRTKCVIDGSGRRTSNDEETFGVTPDTWVRSTMYPIIETIADELGTGYNNCGFVIESFGKDDISSVQIQNSLALPYKFYYVTRENKNKSGTIVETLDNDRYVTATLKADDWNYDLDVTLNADDLLPHAWFNETDTSKTVRFYDVDEFNIYREYVDQILKGFLETEKPFLTTVATSWEDTFESDTMSWTDFIQSDEIPLDSQYGLINIFTSKYSDGACMFSVVPATMRMPDDITNVELDMRSTQQLFMNGGQDGTMTKANFEELVVEDIAKYGNIEDLHYQNLGVNQETIVWDSGFMMDTKLKLAPFMAVRKGTSVVASTFVDGEKFKDFNFALHQSRADKIRKAMVLYPESDTFGTPASRGAIWVGYGKMSGSQKQYPITLELACKINRFIGPSSGIWDDNYVISDEKNKKFTIMHDIHPRDLAYTQQDKLNRAGSNYPLTGSEGVPFLAAFKTVYDDATSGLYSFVTNQGLTVLDRVQYQVWEKFVGYAGTDTNEVIIKRIQEDANVRIAGVCGSSLKLEAKAEMTSADVKRGFSYHLVGKIYASTMKTVQVYHTEIYRISSES